jgi:hypothetical protein
MSGYISRRDTNAVVRKSDNMIVGPEYQTEWAEYQQWLSEGNTPDEPLPEPVIKEPTIEEKLKSVGLTIEELKSALGVK